MSDDPFFASAPRLRAADAVAALLVTDRGYVVQLRDPLPRIFYPGFWGCFGGAVEIGEEPLQALKRELHEELELEVRVAREFTRFDFDLTRLGQSKVFRIYYEISVSEKEVAGLVLHEGADLKVFSARDLLAQPRVTPYDAFAIWLHWKRSRFS